MIQIHRGDRALARLDDAQFGADWDRLAERCVWGSVFQARPFVECWYRLHESQYEPILIEGRDADDRLTGLLTLARRHSIRALVAAGDFHAEYQVWLATGDQSGRFMRAALASLAVQFPRSRLRLSYLPPETPLAWARDSTRPRPPLHLRAITRGVIDLRDPSALEVSLRKGHSRSNLNRLRRVGETRLERISSVDALDADMDTIATLCDLRQGAINDSLPFAGNPLKRPLHLELMRRGLLYPTVLRVGREIASAHLDVVNGDEVLLSVVAHSPVFARQSPGSLHILLLARQLSAEGVSGYDMSPGVGYKERFATRADLVHTMVAYLDPIDRVVATTGLVVKRIATRLLSAAGESPASASRRLDRVRTMQPLSLFGSRRPERSRDAIRVYELRPCAADLATDGLNLNRFADLVAYRSSATRGASSGDFLRSALKRLEEGQWALTRTDTDGLIECWWVRPVGSGDAVVRGGTQALLLHDRFLRSTAVSNGEPGDSIRGIQSRLAKAAPSARLYVAAPEDDTSLTQALERLGSTFVGSIEDAHDLVPRAQSAHVVDARGMAPAMERLTGALDRNSSSSGERR